jgi:O-antigen ligase
LLSLLIIRAPYFAHHTAKEGLLSLVPFVIAIAWMLCQPKRRTSRLLVLLIVGFIALLAVALFRGKAAGVGLGGTQEILALLGSVAALSAFGVLLFTTARDERETWWRLVAVALAPAVYVGTNVLLRFGGYSATEVEPNSVSYAAGTPAKTLALIGIHINREAFPLNPSINGMGVVAAVGLVAAAILALRTNGLERRAGGVGALMCLIALLLTDTRTALILAIVIIALLIIVKRTRVALLLAIIIPFSSWIVTGILSFLSNTGLAAPLARGSKDVSTGNGRTIIWQAAQHQFGQANFFNTLFGFGSNGQATSGASRLYDHLFEGIPSPLLVHVHNLGLQMLLDMGILGLALLVLTVVMGLDRLEKINKLSPPGPVTALIGAMLMLFLTGSTEPSPTYRTQETLVYAVLLLSAAAGLSMSRVKAPVAVARRRVNPYRRPTATPAIRAPYEFGSERLGG